MADLPGPIGVSTVQPLSRSFAYSNTNHILSGQLVEHLGGTTLDESLQARIAQPLGLVATPFPSAERPDIDGLAAGWSPGALVTGDGS